MKCVRLFLFVFLWIAPKFTSAEFLSEDLASVFEESHSYVRDLEEMGYCVIPQLFSTSETELLYKRVWHEYIEKAWPNCKMDDRSNWKEAFPMHNIYGIFTGTAGQTQVMWDLRQDSRIVDIFAKIWNTNDLIVSMDGLSIMCPPEIREGYFKPWPHVDQTILRQQDNISESSLKTNPFTIQGEFLFEDSFQGDGGFYCIPKSHLRFPEFAPELEAINALEIPRDERGKIINNFLKEFFGESPDESGNPYCMKHITAPRGSLILWDSRTVHWNQHPSKDRLYSDNPRVRMVGYLCYVPKTRLTNECKVLRRKAFETGASTGHDPTYTVLKTTKDRLQQEFEHFLEDSSYTQPKINLTLLGESLLN